MGIVKYIWDRIAVKHFNKAHIDAIQKNIHDYCNKVFNTLNSNLPFLYESLVKILVQVIPAALNLSFGEEKFQHVQQANLDYIFSVFDYISRLTSVLYKEEIRYGLERCKITVKNIVNNLSIVSSSFGLCSFVTFLFGKCLRHIEQ